MAQGKLCESDYRFMTVVWESEPIPSGQLAKRCLETLGWKKSTAYTMVKKLSDKGYLTNENGVIRSLISQKDVQSFESEYVVNHAFGGSLPAFVAAFVSGQKLSEKDAAEIRRLLDGLEE